MMGKLDQALTISTILGTIASVYDAHARRRRERKQEASADRRVGDLEERIARLEAERAGKP